MNNYNLDDYVSNGTIRDVANLLMADPEYNVEFTTRYGKRVWNLTRHNRPPGFILVQADNFFILKRIWNAVVFFFKSFDPIFQSNFNNAMNSMNQAYRTYQESLEKQLTLLPGGAPAQTLLPDVIRSLIMSYLNYNSCKAMAAVCRQWKSIIDNKANGLSLLDEKHFSEVVDLKNDQLIKFDNGSPKDKRWLSLLTNAQKLQVLTKFKEEYVNLVVLIDSHKKGIVVTYLKISQIHVTNNEIGLSFSHSISLPSKF